MIDPCTCVGPAGLRCSPVSRLPSPVSRLPSPVSRLPSMSSNTFGKLFSVTTFGESHGPAIGCVVDGCPPGIAIAPEDFVHDLARRATGKSRYTSQRREADEVEILSGVYEGKTTGTPIALLIRNIDARSKDYAEIAGTFRPGHADYTYWQKYGIRDPRGGGRASARETTMRVAAAVIAKKWLKQTFGIEVHGWMAQMDDIVPDMPEGAAIDFAIVEGNPFFWPIAAQLPELESRINALRKAGDSCGARINVVATGVPPGWGEPVYGKLDAELASALMSINAVKGVEIGAGFASVAQKGSGHRDEMRLDGFMSNRAGGILGGISSGQDIVASIALKPTSSIPAPGRSVNAAGEEVEVRTKGRHDPCVGIRATPIAEAMVALVLMDQALRHRAQCGDVAEARPRLPASAR